MKSFYVRGLAVALGLVGIWQSASAAEPFGSASLLPLPSVSKSYDVVTPAAYGYNQEEVSPSDGPSKTIPGQQPGGLSESFAPPVEMSHDYQGAMKQAWDAPAGCSDGSCGAVGDSCGGRGCNRFFFYAGGLILGRTDECDTAITQEVGTYRTVQSTSGVEQDWAGGFEGRIGWVLPNCCNAIEVGYWGLFPSNQMSSVDTDGYPAGIRPVMGSNLDQVYYDDGMTNRSVYDWMSPVTDGTHELSRSFSYNNVEMNFLGNAMAWGAIPGCGPGGYSCNGCGSCCTPRMQFGWLAGVRYFNFDERMSLYTDYNDTMIDGDDDELQYYLRTQNNLWGFQLGGQGSWNVTKCFALYGSGRAGIYNNHVETTQYIQGNNGYGVIQNGAYAGTDYNFMSSRNALAGIGQIDLGMRYDWGCHWSFTSGYRLVGISGVATTPGQIPDNFADSRYMNQVCANDSVILHGAFAGATFRW